MQTQTAPRSVRRAGRRSALRRALVAAGLCLVLGLRLAAIASQGVHWDEFALFDLADGTAVTGVLHSGARPGLAVALLVPLVRGCDDEIRVVREARVLWIGVTALLLAGLGVWLAELEGDPSRRRGTAWLGIALLALLPAFLESSLQVRTDPLAVAGGAWGGACLLASRRRPALALATGACFGLGFLGSQKVLYLMPLAALLAAGQLRLERDFVPRREARRLLFAGAAFAAVLAAFRGAIALLASVPEGHAASRGLSGEYVASGLSLFQFYRRTLGWREYREMLPTLAPQLAALAALAFATPAALRRGGCRADEVRLAWAVALLGLAVGVFHAAAFRYFWITLGVFPAVAIALGRHAIRERLAPATGRAWPAVVAGFWAALALPAAFESVQLLRDTQAVQRESLAFVHRAFAPRDAGFQPESALFCQAGRQTIRTHLSQKIFARFAGPERERNAARMLRTFRETPIRFVVESFRLGQFPPELRRFWSENYQPYRASVFVAGRRLAGAHGEESAFELIVPGRYRWIPRGGPHPLELGGRTLRAGEVVELAAGPQRARFVDDATDGMLVLALDEPPGPAPLPFYAWN